MVERIKIVGKNFDWGFTKHQRSDVNCPESITCKLIWEQFLERLMWSPWIHPCWERIPPLLTLRVAVSIGTLVNSLVIRDVGKAHHRVLFDTSSFSLLHNQILLIPSIPLRLLFLTSCFWIPWGLLCSDLASEIHSGRECLILGPRGGCHRLFLKNCSGW